MMIDAPSIQEKSDEIELTDENSDEVLKLLGIDG